MEYEIQRHSGLNGSPWRKICSALTEEKARIKYDQIAIKLRQGGVRLLRKEEGFNGEVIAETTAPRLRTRW